MIATTTSNDMAHTDRRLHKVVGLKAAVEAIFKMREIAH
jgi:hypothetical protein